MTRSVAQRRMGLLFVKVFVLAVLTAGMVNIHDHSVRAEITKPFDKLPGRWVGQGRLGFKSGAVESIKCRATYFIIEDGEGLKQNIRCATASGKVELKSVLHHDGESVLSGTWEELLYNLAGQLSGKITPNGFRIQVDGDGLRAHMEIVVKNDRQIVEVHFNSKTLIGMTLMLKKG